MSETKTFDVTTFDPEARLVELAQARQRLEVRGAAAQAMRDRFFDLYVKPYDDEIEALEKQAEALEAVLKADVLAYVEATGDLDVNPAITYRRTTRLVYDKAEVLAEAKARGETSVIRVKEELDVRAFEKFIGEGALDWAQVERVPAPTVAIGKLGGLLIRVEVDGE